MSDKVAQARRQVVDIANRLFYERGYNETSFRDIATASGIPSGNVYYYFRTKDDILRAVVEARLAEIENLLCVWNKTMPTPTSRIRAFVKMFRDKGQDMMRYGCPMGSLSSELGKNQAHLMKDARTLFDLFRDWLTEQFAAMGVEPDARQLALHVLGRIQGIVMLSHVYSDEKLLARELDDLEARIGSFANPTSLSSGRDPLKDLLQKPGGSP